MSPEDLEDVITQRCADVQRFNDNADKAPSAADSKLWKVEAHRAAKSVAWLVSLRAPETVARMERERGLV